MTTNGALSPPGGKPVADVRIVPEAPTEPYLRIVPLGGCSEIGRNMTVIETADDIVIVDCGLMFPDEEMFGVDIVISDFSYLRERVEKVRGLLVTHGHEDHIGGIPYFLREFPQVPVIGTALSLALVKAKFREHKVGDVELRTVQPGEVVTLGGMRAEFVHMTHSLAGACSLAISTPLGLIFHTGDFKFDQTPLDGRPADFAAIARYGSQGVLCLLSDSTNAERAGHTPSERTVTEAFSNIFARAAGRIIVASFASNVPRIQQVVDQALRFGRKVAFLGRSMQNVVHYATELGYLHLPQVHVIRIEDVDSYRPEEVVIMTTGSQGEPMSALTRMSLREHPKAKIVPGDTVVISATPIPGNEKSVSKTINNLYRLGAHVFHGAGAHVSGHGSQEELLLMLNLVRPKYFIPVHGEYRMLVSHARLAERAGVAPENAFVVENGDVVEFTASEAGKIGKTYGGNVLVDGSGVGDVGAAVLRDRRLLSSDGIVMIVVSIDAEDSRVVAGPDVMTKGVFYVPEADELLEDLRSAADEALAACSVEGMGDAQTVRERLRESISRLVYERTKRRPVIVPVVMEV